MNVLIVEDEMLIAETIKIYLSEREHNTTEIAISYDEAVTALNDQSIDLVLIDVRLYGEKSGIDLAYFINQNKELPFVFLTSQFDKRIVQNATATNPYGYLTKPIHKESLWTTIEIAFENFMNASSKKEKSYITVSDGRKSILLNENEIDYINSDHVYINVHTNSKSYIFRQSLSQIKEILSPEKFIQCHRSFIVNIKKITAYNADSVFIKDANIPLSRSRKKEVHKLLKINS